MNKEEADVAIIGGGVIGLFCAYHLSKEGKSVIILEKGDIKDACSYGNCGLVSPSHALPLNSPELIIKAATWLFQKDSPFYIKPQLNFKFLSWMLSFVLNANKKKISNGITALNNMLQASMSLYNEFFSDQSLDCDWAPSGIHFVFRQEKSFEAYRIKNEKLAELGLAATPITGNALMDKEPALNDKVYGSWFYEMDASLNPGKLLTELRKLLILNGIQISEGCEVQGFRNTSSRIKEVITSKGDVKAKDVVLASGAWSPWLEKQLHIKIPIIPGKGYSITMKKPALSPNCPCIFEERKVVATPWKDSFRLGGTMEFSGYNTSLNQVRLQTLKKVASDYLKEPFTEENVEEWYGWRPMTNDGIPIVGRSPSHKNLFIACGHNMLGLSMAPATGKLIAELITNQKPHIDPSFYSLERF